MTTHIYEALMAYTARTMALDEVAGLLGWDQETMMPEAGAAQRAEHAAAVEEARHARESSAQISDWLAALEGQEMDPVAARNIALIRRRHERATRLPADLSIELARKTTAAQRKWAAAREANDFKAFAPVLEDLITLKRREAECLRHDEATLYDVLLDTYEADATSAELTPVFDRLRVALAELRAEVEASAGAVPRLTGHFPKAAQLDFAHRLADTFGYDMTAGRIDTAVHPFSSGSGADVRITTRVDEADPAGNIFATIHEMGHAVYEQNIDATARLTPVGSNASMGVHESQSRLFENQIGRSRAFAEWLYPAMRDRFGDFGVDSPQALYAALNRVETGFIRTEADEVHYNLHILLRYDLERDLIDGRLEVADLEGEWNHRFERDFGQIVPTAAEGVLQDVHWSVGYFGYFPTYTLGNIYAAELFARMRGEISGIDDHIARGDLAPILAWLKSEIHTPGALRPPSELIAGAIGRAPTEAALIDYLGTKFRSLYPG